jgi:endonuclease YncB( thermonuclease family)
LSVQKSFIPQATVAVNPQNDAYVVITKVIDGDTIITKDGKHIRYIGINAPEVGQPFASEAAMLNKQLVLGKKVRVTFDSQNKDKYGRVLGYVFSGKTLVNVEIVRNGLAFSEPIAPNISYQKEILQAEQLAKSRCTGVWQSYCQGGMKNCVKIAAIHFDAVGNDTANLNDEWVLLQNTCEQKIALYGWIIKDSSASHTYTFGNSNLASHASLKLHSGCGSSSAADLYWQCTKNAYAIWNNEGDEAMLFDSHGELLSVYKY